MGTGGMKITLPMIKNLTPELLAKDIIGVQPMTESSAELFTIKHVDKEPDFKEGDWRHSFMEGWQTYYGNTWISVDLWWKIKIAGL